jgi:uncharacterized membrane protein HdeD (DUF308 family)
MGAASNELRPIGVDASALCRRTWWVFLIGGIASIAFGLLAFVNPGVALFVLAVFFAAAILVDGAFNIVGALQNREKDGWWLMLLIGLLGAVVGAYALLNPPLAIAAFVLIVAFQAILLGVLLIMLGYKFRKATTREWILYLTGGLSILFGVLVAARPVIGGFTIVGIIAAWAFVIGVLKVAFALRVRNLASEVKSELSGTR